MTIFLLIEQFYDMAEEKKKKEEVAEKKTAAKKDTTTKEVKAKKATKKDATVSEKKTEKKTPAKDTKKKEATHSAEAKVIQVADSKHGIYYENVKVVDLQGNEFFINSTVPGPIKIEESHLTHPTYNPDMKIERVAKGRMEKFLEKQKRIATMK